MDDWFHQTALTVHTEGRLAVHCCLTDTGRLAGFFALCLGTLEVGDLSTKMRGNKVGSIPTVLLARFALSEEFRRQKKGPLLMLEVFRSVAELNAIAPSALLVLDAKNDKLVDFYASQSFKSIPNDKYRMVMKMATVHKNLKDAEQMGL